MSGKQKKTPGNVVEIDSSSDDDEGGRSNESLNVPSTKKISPNPPSPTTKPKNSQVIGLNSRSFWKAGDFTVAPSTSAPPQGQLEHARVHPKFLHSNATSHKWAFGAIAELLDNAVDEIHNGATFVKVDKVSNLQDGSPALLFQDNGGGMDPVCIRNCMSLGYSSKKGNSTIGQYGNGFKTSTMRLGADVIVFTRAIRESQNTQSVGLLSYTFLRKTGQDDVIVPMVDFDISNHWAEPLIYSSRDDWSSNLSTILEWSPFASKEELMHQFEDIGSRGTKIIIYNLWLNDEGIFELNFDDDDEDIRLRDEANCGSLSKGRKRLAESESHISYQLRFSLRAYASILYLRKFSDFNIILRGKPVQQFDMAEELKHPQLVTYRPQLAMTAEVASVEITLGFIKEAPALGVCGFNVYHKNRLIRPFWKVTSEGNSRGKGVVGVLEANFIEPAHDKQDFERSALFVRLEVKLKQILIDYWNKNCHKIGLQGPAKGSQTLEKGSRGQQPSDQCIIDLAANVPKEKHLDQSTVGLAANLRQDSSSGQPANGCRSHFQVDSYPVQPNRLALGSDEEEPSLAGSGFTSVVEICEDNIQLFRRCEEHVQREALLRETVSAAVLYSHDSIEDLEKQLAEVRRKCAEISSRLKTKRENGVKQKSGKVS
ncbi:hypothetical protein RJ641_010631 [Dillenia turbinata]|uniref:Morc S5 domain-containing protein n=1 Tax=Dillenia turbinata TaxID=194707 RepID=A0AAN8V6L2_9MAGN